MRAWEQNMPAAIARLPRDHRGFPIPWCAKRAPLDLRALRPMARERAHAGKRCFFCGESIYAKRKCFVVSPCTLIDRVSLDPPGHPECARWAARNWSEIGERRMGAPGPDGVWPELGPESPAVLAICHSYAPITHGPGVMFFGMLGLVSTEWWHRGRLMTRAEALAELEEAIESAGFLAKGADAECELEIAAAEAMHLLPREAA